jgi:hypothetical protein
MHESNTCLLTGPVTAQRGWWAKPARPARQKPAIRTDLVSRVRAEIAAGTYDTPERFEAAIAKMLLAVDV